MRRARTTARRDDARDDAFVGMKVLMVLWMNVSVGGDV